MTLFWLVADSFLPLVTRLLLPRLLLLLLLMARLLLLLLLPPAFGRFSTGCLPRTSWNCALLVVGAVSAGAMLASIGTGAGVASTVTCVLPLPLLPDASLHAGPVTL